MASGTPTPTRRLIGGLDLGGTKIEARAFADDMEDVARNRIATPTGSYPALLDALLSQVRWLEAQGQMVAIGLGSPGLIDPATGKMLTANLPATGHRLAADLSTRAGRPIPILKDSRAATLSEATDGAASGATSVLGLTIGTGLSGAHVTGGVFAPDLNGQSGEYGHLPLPAATVERHDLPLLPCGCGLSGCFETVLSGPGLTRLARARTGLDLTAEEIFTDPAHRDLRTLWDDIAGDLIALLTRTIDPEVIVLSGGLGMADGLPDRLTAALDGKLLAGTRPPRIVQAAHGDASGARGAALFARATLDTP